MFDNQIPAQGTEHALTGRQVKQVRSALGESQKKFADRFAVSQPVIFRLENAPDQPHTGPTIILISLLAREKGIDVSASDAVEPSLAVS